MTVSVRPVPAPAVRVAPELIADLTAVDLWWIRVPLVEPFVAAHGVEHDREVVLVRVSGAGSSGWGECVALSRPTYTHEYTAGAWVVLRDRLVPAVFAGASVDVATAPMAWTAIESALVDRQLRAKGCSLAAHLGATRDTVACTAVIGMQPDLDALLNVVARRVADGYQLVKLKIEPGRDVEPLRAVRAAWPGLALAADANGSYAGRADDLGALVPLDLRYVEQPLARDDLAAHAGIRRRWGLRVALDESIGSLADLERAIEVGALDIVNLKPGRVGGIAESARVVATAREAGLGVFVGGMLETGVGRALALAFAALEPCTLPTDLGPSARYFHDDVTAPFELLAGARLAVPNGAGLGVTPRPERLAAVTIDHVTLSAPG